MAVPFLALLAALLLSGCQAAARTPTLRPIEAGGTGDISALWIDSAGTLWILAAEPPRIRSLVDGRWTDRSAGIPDGAPLVEFWGNDAGELLLCGVGVIWRLTEAGWVTLVDTGDVDPFRVSGTGDGTIAAVSAYYPRLWRLKIDTPGVREEGRTGVALGDVWMFDRDQVVTVPIERGGVPARLAGGDWARDESWRELPLPEAARGRRLSDIWSPGGGELMAVGDEGLVLRLAGDAWTVDETPTRKRLSSVWGDRPERILAVGDGGTILLHDGGAWTLLPSGTTAALHSVRGRAGGPVYVAGAGGVLLRVEWR